MARKSKLVFKMKSQVLNFSFNDATFWIQILIWFQQKFWPSSLDTPKPNLELGPIQYLEPSNIGLGTSENVHVIDNSPSVWVLKLFMVTCVVKLVIKHNL